MIWQLSIIGVRRGLATAAAKEGTVMLKAIEDIGLIVNRAKLAVVCDNRKIAVEVARAVGAPVKKKEMWLRTAAPAAVAGNRDGTYLPVRACRPPHGPRRPTKESSGQRCDTPVRHGHQTLH